MNIDYRPTIVLVDDERNVLRSLERELSRQFDADFFPFTDSEAALEACKGKTVDVVISDLRMPKVNGIAFLGEVYRRWPDSERILLTGYSDFDDTVRAINEGHINYFIQKPWEPSVLADTVRRCLSITLLRIENKILEAKLMERNADLELLNNRLEDLVLERTNKLKSLYSSTIKTFASLVNLKFSSNQTDFSVENYCYRVAEEIGIDSSLIFHIRVAASLRDVGKFSFDSRLLNRPYVMLSSAEKAQFEQHPLLAEAILATLEPISLAKKIIRSHKEKNDGSGYPKGLKKEDIPQGSKIIAVVNDYYELRCGAMLDRSYTHLEAAQYIKDNTPRLYDEEIVEVFVRVLSGRSLKADADDKEKCVGALNLKPGDTLSRDLYTHAGVFVLPQSTVIDKPLINQLTTIEKNTAHQLNIFIFPER